MSVRLVSLVFMALLSTVGFTGAWAEGLDTDIDRAFELQKQDSAEAIDFLARSLATAEKGDEDPYLLAEGYFYLGRWRADAGLLAEAEETFRRSIGILDKMPEEANGQLKIDAMEAMGMVVGRQKRLASAVTIFNRVLQMQASAKSRTHPDRVRSIEYMAITLEAGGSLRAAEFYWRTALGIASETGLSPDHIAFYRNALADNLENQQRADDAARIRDGDEVPDLEAALLAGIQAGEKLREQEKLDEAHAHYLKLRDDFAKTAGDSTLYMLVLKDVAETADQEEHGKIAAVYEEAIAIQDRLYGLSPGGGNAEFHYLAAREWTFHGDFDRASKGFSDLDQLGNWVSPEVADRGRAVRTILAAALREPGADERCAVPILTKDAFEVLYAGYSIERVFADLGRNASRVPALDCALALSKGAEVEEKFRYATLSALGLALIDTAQYERGAMVFNEALASAEKAGRPPEEIRMLLRGMALADAWTRRFKEGLVLVDRAEAIPGAAAVERLSLLRVRALILVNATRYPEAEVVLGEALALAESIPQSGAFDDDHATTLNDLVTVLTRVGRLSDALALTERIALPEVLPPDASAGETIFYLDIKENRAMLLFALGRGEEARAAVASFRDAAIPVVDRLLANRERNAIMAGSIASILTRSALALAGLDFHTESEEFAARAADLVASDQSEGVRLLLARNELVRAYGAMVRADIEAALTGFDRALEAGGAILPDQSDEMLEMWVGRGIARRLAARSQEAIADLRRGTEIAKARIARESRFDDIRVQRKLRPSFENLVQSAWEVSN